MQNAITVLIAGSQLMLAGTLGGLWLQDRRRPPSQRSTHVGHAIAALLALGIGVAVLALAEQVMQLQEVDDAIPSVAEGLIETLRQHIHDFAARRQLFAD